MKAAPHFLPIILALVSVSSGWAADSISWLGKRGSLTKAGFSMATATHTVHSDSGANQITITMRHRATSRDLFTFSKWEIDRWGDPAGQQTSEEGSWQVVSNAANDVVLGLWGFWGSDGAPTTPRVVPNEFTSYEIELTFAHPITDLELPIHGINALFTNNEYNSVDELTLHGYLNGHRTAPILLDQLGAGVTRRPPGVAGALGNSASVGTSTYGEGSLRARASHKLDRIVLTYTNRAISPATGTFHNGQQAWSVSLGELHFENEPVDPSRHATTIEWLSRKGQLAKPGFTSDTATTTALSEDGHVRTTLTLEHSQTTPGLTTYSKWEIDQWGDPTGEFFAPGSWQIVTDAANSVVLGLWGYWGGPGEITANGDFTCYRLILDFDHPVHDLNLPLHGINGFLKPSDGFNSGDEVEITAQLSGTAVARPSFVNVGRAMKQVGHRLVGDYTYQIDDGISGQHMSNEGSCQARFSETVDRVTITLINRAGHPNSTAFQNGLQTWSMAIGNLTFTHQAQALTNLSRQPGVAITQSSTLHPHTTANHLNDGNTNGNLWDQAVNHTDFEDQAWIQIDLGAIRQLSELLLWERTDPLATSLDDLILFVSKTPLTDTSVSGTEASPGVTTIRNFESLATGSRVDLDLSARYIRLQRQGSGALSLAELEILGPASNALQSIPPATVSHETHAIDSSSPNPLVDQLGHFTLKTQQYPAGLDIEETSTGIDLRFQRPAGLDSAVGYSLELSPDLIAWTPVAIEASPLDSIHLENIDTLVPGLLKRGFARIRTTITATNETTTTKVVGWYKTTCHEGFQTHGISLNRSPFGAGRILSLNGTLQATVSSSMDLTNLGPAYMEIIDGAYVGHRMELQAITNNDGTSLLEGTSKGSTLTALSDDMIGAAVVIRPHWTLEAAYPAAKSTPARDPASAAQILFYENGHYRTFYSLAHPDRTYWTQLRDSMLQNAGLEVIAPGQGIFLCQPDGQPHEVTVVGHVRDHLFRQPLTKGRHLVAQAHPIAQTPSERLLNQTNGFQSARDPENSDTIQLWQGDLSPLEQAFDSYFYFSSLAPQAQPFWVNHADDTLTSHNETALFFPDRATFIEVKADHSNYHNPLSLPN